MDKKTGQLVARDQQVGTRVNHKGTQRNFCWGVTEMLYVLPWWVYTTVCVKSELYFEKGEFYPKKVMQCFNKALLVQTTQDKGLSESKLFKLLT